MKISKLHEAARDGDIASLRQLIATGADIEQLWKGCTPIVLAVDESQEAAFELLVERGANVFWRDPVGGDGLLHIAAKRCSVNLCMRLIGMGLAIEEPDNNGDSPLLLACSGLSLADPNCDCFPTVELLVSHGANVNRRNSSYGTTPLIEAARSGNSHVCELLLQHGADSTVVNDEGESFSSVRDQFIESNGFW